MGTDVAEERARKLYREIKDAIIKEGIESLVLSLDLAEVAPLYRDIVRAREDDAELRRQLQAIRALDARAHYPVLLAGYAAAGDEDGGEEKLSLLASALVTMFVRYNVIGGRETTVWSPPSTTSQPSCARRRTSTLQSQPSPRSRLMPKTSSSGSSAGASAASRRRDLTGFLTGCR